jgi:DNA-binding NtrC family response regulator
MPDRPKQILSVAGTEALRKTRELLLTQAGFLVVSAMTSREINHVCRRTVFDLAVVGHAFEDDQKLKAAETIRQVSPQLPILEICRISPLIPGAEYVLHNPEPEELVKEVNRILRPGAE